MQRSALGLTAIGIASLVLISGCTASAGNDTSQSLTEADSWNAGGEVQIPEPDPVEDFNIAFIGFGKDNPWSQYAFEALEDEAKRFGATASFIGPASFDPQAQYQLLADLSVSQQFDMAVVIAADGPSLVPAVEQAVAAGVIVVPMNMAVGADPLGEEPQVDGVVTSVLENLTSNAEAMADGVITACADVDPCEVGVLWGVRALGFDRVKPPVFTARLEDHPNVHVVCESDAAYTQDLGRTQTADCLQAHPDLHVIASQADESSRGAELSIEAAGRTVGLESDDIKIVSSYGSRYGIEQVRAGKWLSTTYNRPGSMAKACVRLGILISQGHDVPSFVPMEKLDDLPLVLTKDVLDEHPDLLGQWEG